MSDSTANTSRTSALAAITATRINADKNFSPHQLTPGRWYCLGFRVPDQYGEERDDFGSIYKLEAIEEFQVPGEPTPRVMGVWIDEHGEQVDTIVDPVLGDYCTPDAADFYVVQS